MPLQLINKASGNKINILKDNIVTFGRGSEIECLDKRISRKHISISYTKEHAILSVLNCNPCFTMKNDSMIHINKKNDVIVLMHGDIISFLPDFQTCAFEVSYKSDDDEAPGSPSFLGDISSLVGSNQKCDFQQDSCEYFNLQRFADTQSNNVSLNATSNNYYELETNLVPDRPLPAATPDLVQSDDTPTFSTIVPPLRLEKNDCNEIDNCPPTSVTPDLIQTADFSTKITLAKNLFVNSCVNEVTVPAGIPRNPLLPTTLESDVGDSVIKTEKNDYSDLATAGSPSLLDNISDTLEAPPAKRQALSANISSCNTSLGGPETFMVKPEPADVITTEPNLPTQNRHLCRYGQSCYRKNEQHKIEFSHPGDNDWVSDEQKPLCRFDPFCYRKCPDHRINVRHTCELPPPRERLTPSVVNELMTEFFPNSDISSEEDNGMESDAYSSELEE